MKFQTPIFILLFIFAAHATSSIPDSLTPSPPAKSETVAYGWALCGTLIPSAVGATLIGANQDRHTGYATAIGPILLVSGLAIGPSSGQFYAGSTGKGALGVLIRLSAGLGIFFAGGWGASDAQVILGSTFAGLAYTAGTVYSIMDTPKAVKRANEKAEAAHAAHFDLFPTLAHNVDGTERVGMMARLSF